jgi:hypothetical protein
VTAEDALTRFEQIGDHRKPNILAILVLALTVEARSATIDLAPTEAVTTYRGINELQHLVSNQLCAYLTNGNTRPGKTFWVGLYEVAERFHLQDNLSSAISWSFSRDSV